MITLNPVFHMLFNRLSDELRRGRRDLSSLQIEGYDEEIWNQIEVLLQSSIWIDENRCEYIPLPPDSAPL